MVTDFKAKRAVAIWIGIGVLMLFIQVLLGGITRLTGSGLSITEWQVITGTIPPLDHSAWLTAFEKYKATPQYRLLNTHFSLADFKYIFFWEWIHRFWARLIGIVFIFGFVYMAGKKYLKKDMQRPLIILFLFGALQGLIGWVMVKSGLSGDEIYVKPIRLSAHFIFALGLIAYAHWFFLQLIIPENKRNHFRSAVFVCKILLMLLFIQFIFGALMAGHKAATAAPTWPDINGEIIPSTIWKHELGARNFVENKTTIHFVHRTFGYLLFLATLLFTGYLQRILIENRFLKKIAVLPLICTIFQLGLGVLAILFSLQIVPNQWGIFETIALLHQITAMLLLLSIVTVLYIINGKSSSIPS